jgi:hypothetical protein
MSDQQADGAAAEPAAEGEAQPRMPLFYRRPQPVNPRTHGKLGFRDTADLGFAAATNVLPVNVGEIAIAAKYYPVVFGVEPPHLPVAICGLRNGQNLFVTPDRQWVADYYIPAYVRRYPFIFQEAPEQGQMILCVDVDSGLLVEDGERRLFQDDGKPTEIVDRALEFCRLYHQQHLGTRAFVDELTRRDLLVDDQTDIRLGDDRRLELKGYKIVDREKFNALDDAVFLDWRKNGWLPAIYYHLQSGSNWPNVMRQLGRVAVAAARDQARPNEDGEKATSDS